MTDSPTAAFIRINGQQEAVSAATIAGLLTERRLSAQPGLAVALNGHVVPKTSWSATLLAAGDEVEIVVAKQGG